MQRHVAAVRVGQNPDPNALGPARAFLNLALQRCEFSHVAGLSHLGIDLIFSHSDFVANISKWRSAPASVTEVDNPPWRWFCVLAHQTRNLMSRIRAWFIVRLRVALSPL